MSQCVSHLWRFENVKQLMLEAGDLIGTDEAARRVLVLENPGLRGKSQTTNTLFAGIQMILPGEAAPAHRHVASAIRFILHGEGAYTHIDGKRVMMNRGDLIITPSWAVHDYGTMSEQEVIWLDVLDLPTVRFFEAGFFEHCRSGEQAARSGGPISLSSQKKAHNPVADSSEIQSAIVNYPYPDMRVRLDQLASSGSVDRRWGTSLYYGHANDRGRVTPTMGARLSLLPSDFKGCAHRSTDGSIFVCVEGKGMTTVAHQTLEWSRGDVFIIPPWRYRAHNAIEETILFCVSDRPAQEALGIWYED
jgi:gentisate 1,2-dioxygenase